MSSKRKTPGQILEDHRSHANDEGNDEDDVDESYRRDCSTEAAREVITEWAQTHVGDLQIASSKQIVAATEREDVRVQDIGRTLGSHLVGKTPDGFLDEYEVSAWRDSRPRKWVFDRVAGEQIESPRSTRLYRHQLIDEITAELNTQFDADLDVEVYRDQRSNSKKVRIAWMRAAVSAIAELRGESIGSIVTKFDEEGWQTKEQYINTLTKGELTSLLEGLVEADEKLWSTYTWPRPTMMLIHDILVEGVDPTEVDA